MKIVPVKDMQFLGLPSIYSLFSFDISPYLSMVEFEPDDYIFKNGELPDCLYCLVKGTAILSLYHSNGRKIARFMESPCFIGETELLKAQELTNEVKAQTLCLCYKISLASCMDTILSDPVFLRNLCLYMSKNALYDLTSYARTQAYPVVNRLAQFILLMARNGLYKEKHTEVSDYLGTSYRHLLYVFADLCKRGILSKEPQGYRIADPARLKALADVVS